MRQEKRPTGLGCTFSPPAYSNTTRKRVKPEGNDYLQSHISRTPYPQLEGAQDSVTTYSPEKASIPQNET